MKQRIYADTSVFGGYYDEEFADHTIPFFDRLKNEEFILLFSTVTQEELENAPEKVKELVRSLNSNKTEFLETTIEAIDLATEYITEQVVGWNFKHIVNIQRIRGFNAINIKNGYRQLEIRSPREFEKYEDD